MEISDIDGIYSTPSWVLEGRLRDDCVTEELMFPINTDERTCYLRNQEEVRYVGSWFDQSSSHSCAAWAAANAGMVLGSIPHLDSIWDLSARVNEKSSEKRGLKFSEVMEYVNEDPRMAYGFAKLQIANKENQRKRDVFTPLQAPTIDFQNLKARVPLDVFLEEILEQLKLHKPILVSVVSKLFSEEGLQNHALCISGYRISNSGQIDLQVLDSARGIYWVPEERIRKSRDFLNDVLIADLKKSEADKNELDK